MIIKSSNKGSVGNSNAVKNALQQSQTRSRVESSLKKANGSAQQQRITYGGQKPG